MKTIHIYIIGIILVFSSCFKDSLEDCPVILYLYCESVMKKYDYENIVDQLNVYLYDQGDQLVNEFTFTRHELMKNNFNAMIPIQHYGNYTVVAAINPFESYTVSGTGYKNSYMISLNANAEKEVNTRQNDLYHGHKELMYTFTGILNRYDTIDVFKDTNHINLDLEFEYSLPVGATVSAYIKGNNGSFGFDNKCHSNSERIYLPHNKDINTGSMSFRFTTMQLWIGSDLILCVEEESNGQKRIANQLNLVEYIASVPEYDSDEKLDQEDIFNIRLVLKSDKTILELVINDWYIIRAGVKV